MNWRRRVVIWSTVILAPLPTAAAVFGNGVFTLGIIVLYGAFAAAGSAWSDRPRVTNRVTKGESL